MKPGEEAEEVEFGKSINQKFFVFVFFFPVKHSRGDKFVDGT